MSYAGFRLEQADLESSRLHWTDFLQKVKNAVPFAYPILKNSTLLSVESGIAKIGLSVFNEDTQKSIQRGHTLDKLTQLLSQWLGGEVRINLVEAPHEEIKKPPVVDPLPPPPVTPEEAGLDHQEWSKVPEVKSLLELFDGNIVHVKEPLKGKE